MVFSFRVKHRVHTHAKQLVKLCVRFQDLTAAGMTVAVFRGAAPCGALALATKVASTFEKSVKFYQNARRNITEENYHQKKKLVL
jgi:hypothetical protein